MLYNDFIRKVHSSITPGRRFFSFRGAIKEIIKVDEQGTVSYFEGERRVSRIYSH